MKHFIYQLLNFRSIISEKDEVITRMSLQENQYKAQLQTGREELDRARQQQVASEKIITALKQAYDELKNETQATISEQLDKLREQEALAVENAKLNSDIVSYRKRLLAANGKAGHLQCELNKYRIKKNN